MGLLVGVLEVVTATRFRSRHYSPVRFRAGREQRRAFAPAGLFAASADGDDTAADGDRVPTKFRLQALARFRPDSGREVMAMMTSLSE